MFLIVRSAYNNECAEYINKINKLCYTTIRQNTARYRGVRIWNSLDDALKIL